MDPSLRPGGKKTGFDFDGVLHTHMIQLNTTDYEFTSQKQRKK